MPEKEGPFVASDEKTEDGRPVGVEVPGSGRPESPHGAGGPVDDSGDLDDPGQTAGRHPQDSAEEDVVRHGEDREPGVP